MKGFLTRLLLFLALLGIVIELFFRFVVPASMFPSYRTNVEYSILQFDTAYLRDGVYTSGRLARDRADWHVNDHGWNSRVEFKRPGERELPCMVIFGDSYIEAFLTGLDEHVDAYLGDRFAGRYEVYGMGVSGGIFAHYLQMARYSKELFDPEIMIFFINNGDIKASLADFGRRSLFSQFKSVDDGFVELPVRQHRSDWVKQLMKRSALVRYLTKNANVNLLGGNVDVEATAIGRPRGLTHEQERLLRDFAAYATELLRREHPETEFIFLFDANRKAMYSDKKKPPRLYDSLLLEEPAAANGIHLLDLTETFYEDHRANGTRLSFDYDYHWNAYTNRLVADTLGDFIEQVVLEE
jgi:hypothetical protein